MGRKKIIEDNSLTTCRLCGKYMKINSDGLPAYHADCAKIAGVDHGPLFAKKRMSDEPRRTKTSRKTGQV